jgi:putative ABC transport system permease protein
LNMPDWKEEITRRLRPLKLMPAREAEIIEELTQHLEDRYKELVSGGATEEEAQRKVLQEMSDEDLLARGLRRVEQEVPQEPLVPGGGDRGNFLRTIWQDIRYGLRMFAKNPGFSAVAVLTLALGIGANTAIFTVLNTVVLRPLPFKDPGQLVRVGESDLHEAPRIGEVSYPNFLDWKAENHVFEGMAVFHTGAFTLIGANEAVHLEGAVVSSDLFSLLGVFPTMGRNFSQNEDQPAGGSTGRPVIVSWESWQARFAADPGVLGTVINLDNNSFTVVGVMPKGFQFPIQAEPAQLWVTIGTDAEKTDEKPPATAEREARYLQVVARLKPKVTLAEARADMAVVASHLEKEYPGPDSSTGAWLVPELGAVVGDFKAELFITFAAVGFVLLIGCANVANLLLVKATARKKEIAIRAALGANRSRIARQMVTESLLLSVIGASLGLMLAIWGTRVFASLNPLQLPRLMETGLDAWVLGFAVLLTLLTGLLFGLAPAARASKADLTEGLREGGGLGGITGRLTLRNALVVGEIALALVLAAGAGLLAESLRYLTAVHPGFDPHNVLTFNVDLPGTRYSFQQRIEFYRDLIVRLKALPEVEAASAIAGLPFGGQGMACSFKIEGHPTPKGEYFDTDFHAVAAGYFRTMKIPLVQGRDFTERDDLKATPVVIINQTLARRFFPRANPVGKRIRPAISNGYREAPMREIVGVVADVQGRGLARPPAPDVYVPEAQSGMVMTGVVRTKMDPRGLVGAVRSEVRGLDKQLPLYDVMTLDQYLATAVSDSRFNALVLGLFAALALVLTAIGIYGVVSYTVAQRTHEIGLRMALGAGQSDALKLILTQAFFLALAGVVAGLIGAFGLTRFLASLLYEVKPDDPATLTAISLLIMGVALFASYIPARRATKVDPMVALRYE